MLYRCRIGAYGSYCYINQHVCSNTQVHSRKGGLLVQKRLHPRRSRGQQAPQRVPQTVRHQLRHPSLQNPARKRLVLPRQKVRSFQLREFNYDVRLKGAGYAFMICNVLMSWRIYVNKAMVWWPVLTIPLSYAIIAPM
jgi:hypothetical protein